jgi:hypothetical protein
MHPENNQCDRPKSKFEQALDFGKYFLKWLAKNKTYGTLLFLGIMAAIAFVGYNVTITWSN